MGLRVGVVPAMPEVLLDVYATLRLKAEHESKEKVPNEILLSSGEHSIGRNKPGTGTTGTQIELPYISGVHCIVKRSGGRVEVVDKSSNGTFVNGEKVGKGISRELRPNDTITLFKPQVSKNEKQLLEYVFVDRTAISGADEVRLLRERCAKLEETNRKQRGEVKAQQAEVRLLPSSSRPTCRRANTAIGVQRTF